MKTGDKTFRQVKQTVLLASVIIAVCMLVFAIFSVTNTHIVAVTADTLYEEGYSAMLQAQRLQAWILRSSDLVALYVDTPDSAQGQQSLTELFSMRSEEPDMINQLDTIATSEELEQLRTSMNDLAALHDLAIERASAGQSADEVLETSAYSQTANSLTMLVNTLMERGTERAEQNALEATRIDERATTGAIVFAVAVLGVTAVTATLVVHRIQKLTMEMYKNAVIFNLITENGDDVFEIYNFETNTMEYVSENLQRILGYEAAAYEDNVEAMWSNIEDDDLAQMREMYYDPELRQVTEFEFRYTHPDKNEPMIFRTTMYPIINADGVLTHHVCITHEVTTDVEIQRKLRGALNEAERASRSRQEFMSRMSHEIRTPLNAMIGMEALAAANLDDPNKLKRYLGQMRANAQHLLSLVNDILDMSKIENGGLALEYASFDMDNMLSDLTLMMQTRLDEKQQSLRIDMARCRERHLIGDELRLRQILLNLLSNANKYTGVGGDIRLTLRQSTPKVGFVRMTFSVEDNGMGIPRSEIDRIFLPWERGAATDRMSGTGLGLPISKHLVEEMGGSIWVESEDGKGSVFSFEVPLGVASEEGADKLDVLALPARPYRLLVAEDNEINMEIAQELMTSAGFEVEGATNGLEALNMFEEQPQGYYDAIIMDIQMPIMDGTEATKAIRTSTVRDGNAQIVVAMSADVFKEGPNKGNEAHDLFDAFISKPIEPERMEETLRQVISGKRRKKRKTA